MVVRIRSFDRPDDSITQRSPTHDLGVFLLLDDRMWPQSAHSFKNHAFQERPANEQLYQQRLQ